ncbi:MAG: type II toxin-antitoxin system VapC family toxin [Spirochaetota bacterium]
MRQVMIDTNVYTAFKLGLKQVVETLQRADYIGINVVVLGELYSGFKAGAKEKQNRKELESFLNSPRTDVVTIDENTAEFFAEVYRVLRKKGRPIPTNDMWIAASAMQNGLSLYTLDSHFQHIDGLLLKK